MTNILHVVLSLNRWTLHEHSYGGLSFLTAALFTASSQCVFMYIVVELQSGYGCRWTCYQTIVTVPVYLYMEEFDLLIDLSFSPLQQVEAHLLQLLSIQYKWWLLRLLWKQKTSASCSNTLQTDMLFSSLSLHLWFTGFQLPIPVYPITARKSSVATEHTQDASLVWSDWGVFKTE